MPEGLEGNMHAWPGRDADVMRGHRVWFCDWDAAALWPIFVY